MNEDNNPDTRLILGSDIEIEFCPEIFEDRYRAMLLQKQCDSTKQKFAVPYQEKSK